MNIQLITLLLLIDVCLTYKPRKQINQRPIATKKSLKKSDVVPARYKVARRAHHEPVVVNNFNLPYFPEVDYPTDITEVSKPFYFTIPKSESLFNQCPHLKPSKLTIDDTTRRDSRNTDFEDHSNLLHLIESLKRNGTKNNTITSSTVQQNDTSNARIYEKEDVEVIKLNQTPEILRNEEVRVIFIEKLPQLLKPEQAEVSEITHEENDEYEVEYLDNYDIANDDYGGSGDSSIDVMNGHNVYDYIANDTSTDESEYSSNFLLDLLEYYNNYTDFIILEGPISILDECSEETIDGPSGTNMTDESHVSNSSDFLENKAKYDSEYEILTVIPTNSGRLTGSPDEFNLISEVTKAALFEDLPTSVRSVKKIALPQPSLKTRRNRKLHRKRLLSKPKH